MARGLIGAFLLVLAAASPAAAGWSRLADSTGVGYGVRDSLDAALLGCRCRGGIFEMFVTPGPADSARVHEVEITLDTSSPYRETWIGSADGASLSAPDARAFALKVLRAESVRLRPVGSPPLTFQVHGFEKPVTTVLAACPFPTPESLGGSAEEQPIGQEDLPVAISKVPPVYPDDARARHVTGTVVVQVLIDEQGKVIDTKVVRSIPGLDEAAVASLRQWRFTPARTDGKPVRVWTAIPIRFSMDGK